MYAPCFEGCLDRNMWGWRHPSARASSPRAPVWSAMQAEGLVSAPTLNLPGHERLGGICLWRRWLWQGLLRVGLLLRLFLRLCLWHRPNRGDLAVCDPAVEFLQRSAWIDQTPAVPIVATLGVQVARGRGQHFENGAGIGVRMPLQQQRGDAAHMRGRDRRAGGELVGFVGRRHHDVDAGCRDREMRPAHGPREQAGRSSSVAVTAITLRIGGRIERRRFRAHVARRRDQDDALGGGVAHRQLDHRDRTGRRSSY